MKGWGAIRIPGAARGAPRLPLECTKSKIACAPDIPYWRRGVCVEQCDAVELTGPMIRDLDRRPAVRGLGKGGRVIVINEAHG
jgi:hypothetical protein